MFQETFCLLPRSSLRGSHVVVYSALVRTWDPHFRGCSVRRALAEIVHTAPLYIHRLYSAQVREHIHCQKCKRWVGAHKIVPCAHQQQSHQPVVSILSLWNSISDLHMTSLWQTKGVLFQIWISDSQKSFPLCHEKWVSVESLQVQALPWTELLL